jgi:serine/threonine protein kinase
MSDGFSIGSRIAGYRLDEQIGAGGMAVVFRATDERLGRQVALKILAPGLTSDSDFRQRFIMEARAAAAVDDPHIIPIFEAGEADDALYIAMRYVRGGDVRTLLARDGPMSAERAVAGILAPVALALDAAHAAGLIHRDVKPANMLVDSRPGRRDHVYLSDFGLTRAAQESTSLTGSGVFLGTPDYVSPEQIRGEVVDGRTDQYALACSAFAMLTGAPPFARDQAVAVIYAHVSEPPPLLTSQCPDAPPEVDQVMAKALAKASTERYASCGEFADALMTAFGLTGEADQRRNWAAPAAQSVIQRRPLYPKAAMDAHPIPAPAPEPPSLPGDAPSWAGTTVPPTSMTQTALPIPRAPASPKPRAPSVRLGLRAAWLAVRRGLAAFARPLGVRPRHAAPPSAAGSAFTSGPFPKDITGPDARCAAQAVVPVRP